MRMPLGSVCMSGVVTGCLLIMLTMMLWPVWMCLHVACALCGRMVEVFALFRVWVLRRSGRDVDSVVVPFVCEVSRLGGRLVRADLRSSSLEVVVGVQLCVGPCMVGSRSLPILALSVGVDYCSRL